MKPIFHLSVPVHDLELAIAFYRDQLGAIIGRKTEHFVDVLLFGAQITLQNNPPGALNRDFQTGHFGATVEWQSWETLAMRFADSPMIYQKPMISHQDEPLEQAKFMIFDPSRNLIEIKAYRRPWLILGPLMRCN